MLSLLEFAQAVSMDLEATLARFGQNQGLLLRFLRQFPQDESMSLVTSSLAKGDDHGLEYAAHSLKGLSANLGLGQVYQDSSRLVKAVREKDHASFAQLAAQLEKSHRAAVEAVSQLEG